MKKKVSKKKLKEDQPENVVFPNWKNLSKYSILIISLITIGALIVRAYRVGYLTIWLDEYMHINPALDILKGNSIREGDINGIFLTWCVTGFFKLFGISELVARIPSIIFGTATVPLIYFLGKKLYNKSIGITAALLNAFSLYVICWSRLARNYASFEFSYLILLIIIWLSFNLISKSNKTNYLRRNGINQKYLLILPFAFIFSLLNHQLTFFSIFALSAFIIIKFTYNIIKRKPKAFTNLYSILSYLIIIGIVIFFTPSLLEKIARPILGILLPERIINWVLPDWDFIFNELKNPEKRFKSFMIYFNVLKNDYTKIYILGILGVVSSFFIPQKRKEATFLFTMFTIPLLLMSFIFREPSTPNYLYYIYPIFLIYIAIFIYFFFNRLLPLILPDKYLKMKWVSNFSLLVIVIILFASIPKDEIKSLIKNTDHGQIVKKELFHSSLVNWKEICNQVKPYVKKQDVVLSTWPSATNFYLERDNSVWFRQRHYDSEQRRFVNNEPNDKKPSAYSLENLTQTYRENKTGWLFADYYFENVLTDPRARDFAIRNFDYHFNLGKDGAVQVFSWDHNRTKKYRNTMLIELGKNNRKLASKELNFTLQTLSTINKGLMLIADTEGIDQKNEAYIIVNNKNTVVFNVPDVGKFNNISGRRQYNVFIDKSWLKEGENTLQFGYNNTIKDFPKGFVIYNINFLNQ